MPVIPLPTAPRPPYTREQALAMGEGTLRAYGKDPQPVDAHRMTYREALLLTRHDPEHFIGPDYGMPADRTVWVVRLRGTYSRWGLDPEAKPGIGLVIIDGTTGMDRLNG